MAKEAIHAVYFDDQRSIDGRGGCNLLGYMCGRKRYQMVKDLLINQRSACTSLNQECG